MRTAEHETTQTTETAFPEHALTAEDLAAAKTADHFTAHLDTHGSFLRLYLRGSSNPAIFTVRQQRLFPDSSCVGDRMREIPATASAYSYDQADYPGWRWSTNEGPSGSLERPPYCFYSKYANETWATIVRSLRVGDRLHLSWIGANNNEYLTEAGLYADEVRLVATSDKSTRTWLLGYSVCADNSARMVRRHG